MSEQGKPIIIRPGGEADLPVIEALLRQGEGEFADDSDFFRFGSMDMLRPILLDGHTLLAFVNDEPAGMVSVLTAKDWWYIVALVVDEKHRGLGVATALLVEAKQLASDRGAVRGATTAAPRLVEFYRKNGYRPVATVMEHAI